VLAVHRAAVGAHLTLILLVIAWSATATLPLAGRLGAALAGTLPLVLGLPGLLGARRYTCQWLAVALVLYAGGAVVEVVATAGRAYLPALVLLAALLDLGLVVILSRALRPTTPRG
jgi:uncharacterized membrane protein